MSTSHYAGRFSPWKQVLGLVLLVIGLQGCDDISTAPSTVASVSEIVSSRAEKSNAHRVDGYAFIMHEAAHPILNFDRSLSILCETYPCSFWSDVSDHDSSHFFTHPLETRPGSRFETRLDGRIAGKPSPLGSIIHETREDGSTLLRLHLPEAMQEHTVGGYVRVSFLWQGAVQYQTTRPIQPYVDLAYYNTSDESTAKSTDTDDEGPTSYYWACVEDTCGWMVDWEEGESSLSDPVTLVPAFPTPFKEIPVDYLRVEIQLDTDDVKGEKVWFTFSDMPGCTISHVE